MRPQIVKILTLVLFISNSTAMLAQSLSSDSAGPPAPNRGAHPPELPISDGIEVLLCIALVYGCYIAYKRFQLKNIH